jgi:hypothetical protein
MANVTVAALDCPWSRGYSRRRRKQAQRSQPLIRTHDERQPPSGSRSQAVGESPGSAKCGAMGLQPEMRDRILAPVATRDAEGNVTGANLGALVRRLILFDQVIIDSFAMQELPALNDALGPEQFVDLLQSRAVLIRADGWALGEIGNASAELGRDTPLPPLSFALAPLVPVPEGQSEHISRRLGEIRAMQLDMKTFQRVRLAIVDSLTPFPENPGRMTMDQVPVDLTMRLDLVRTATDWALRKFGDRDPEGVDYSIRLDQETELVFRAETNIGERFALDEDEVDRVLERAVLAVGALSEWFELMESYNAVTGLKGTELSILDAKLTSILQQIDPERQEQRLIRVLELTNLPDPETAEGTVNVERLLAVREHQEIVEFRHWLRTLDSATDEEIRDRVNSVRERMAEAVHSPTGKVVRFAATAAADLLPFGGLVAGAVDEFVLERVLPQPGPVSFLGSTYRSLFEP